MEVARRLCVEVLGSPSNPVFACGQAVVLGNDFSTAF